MIINKEEFITEMAKRNGVTKKASREYTDLFLKTFFELLTEGYTIRFCRLFSAFMVTGQNYVSVNDFNVDASKRVKNKPYKRLKIRLSVGLKKKINEIMMNNEEEGQ